MNISPSLRRFNERYYLSGKYISDDQLHDLLVEVENINNDQSITFHEFICACFFLAASRNKSNVNILESGLFFRLDASNVLEKNIASVVMPIGIDHKDFLKKGTIDEIVYEKCSHLLEGSKIVISEQKNDVLEKIKKNIANNSSEKFENNFDAKVKELIYLGDHIRSRVEVCGNDQFIVKIPNSYKGANLKEGATVKLSWKASDSRALDLN